MTNDDELRDRLRRSAPGGGGSVDPATGPVARRLMEQIMNTPETPTIATSPAPRPSRRWLLPAVAAGLAVVALAAVGIATLGGDDDKVATSVNYSLTPSDPMMGMCLPVTDYVPTPDVVGFRGTVIATADTSVTLEVTRWYAGGDADQVVLDITGVGIPALDGVEFVQGGDYLVTVLDGQVLTCGLSAPFDPTLEALFEGWFPA